MEIYCSDFHLPSGAIVNRTCFNHFKTKLVQYLDLCCTLFVSKISIWFSFYLHFTCQAIDVNDKKNWFAISHVLKNVLLLFLVLDIPVNEIWTFLLFRNCRVIHKWRHANFTRKYGIGHLFNPRGPFMNYPTPYPCLVEE